MAAKSAPANRQSSLEDTSVNQIEENRALRYIETLRKQLKQPVPRIQAVLSYLRWLDRQEKLESKKKLSDFYRDLANKRKEENLYSWNNHSNEPIVLPKIRKHPDPEKYRSRDLKSVVFDDSTGPSSKRISRTADPKTLKSHPKSVKPSPFYVHASAGFKYWPEELYRPPVPKTKYTFGSRFRPGRAGVIVDRIYDRPKCNTHYWTEFQQHQNPIGSGNCVQGKILSN